MTPLETSSIVEWAAALATVTTACGIVVKAVTRDVASGLEALRHTMKNQIARIDAVEHLRTNDIERIVKLESAVQSFEKAIERIEKGQDRINDTINDRFDTLAESIREIRTVAPR